MASWIFSETGVKRPQVPSADLGRRATTWTGVAGTATTTLEQIDAIIADVMSRNSGRAADAFNGHMTGPRSSRHVVDILRDASTQYAAAHRRASATMALAVALMDASAAASEAEYVRILRHPMGSMPGAGLGKYFLLRRVIKQAREKLLGIEAKGAEGISDVYASVQFTLPPDAPANLSMVDDPERGIVDPAVREMWDELDDDEKKAVLEQMARDYAEANGVDPDSLTFYWNDPSDPEDFQIDGVGQARRDGTIILNAEDYFNDPTLMHTSVHEVQHVVQFRAIDEYEAMSQAERDAIAAGSAADPFSAYGTNIEEVAEWKNNWDTGYIEDPWADYHSQPVEVDARNSGRHDGASMDEEEFEELLDRAGVR